jgi:arylsulfatase A-like enzyme
MLKSVGYDTAIFGKWHLGYRDKFWPNAHGFDEYLGFLGGGATYFTHREPEEGGHVNFYHNTTKMDVPGYTTDLFANKAIEWLKVRPADRPFFLYMPFNAPHQPIQDPDSKDPDAIAPAAPRSRPTYCKMVERLDASVGRLLMQLDRMGAAENTIVLFLSDNGADPNGRNEPYRGRKTTVWEGGIRVPLLIRWPGVVKPGTVTAQPAITMDLLPTFLAAAGAKAPAGRKLDGVNLVPFLRGEQGPFSRTLFWRYKRMKNVRKAVREGNLKYVSDNGEEALHDLASDEREQRNLLPGRSADAEKLKAKLAAWERDVMAPRLRPFRSEPG